jgi:hypothetical protein
MNTEQVIAFGTSPPIRFASHEMSYAELLYVYEILDHAHSILGFITPIQVIQPVAREPVATETVFGFPLPQLFTVLDPACDAGLGLDAVAAAAAGAWVLISRIGDAEATVHAARSNQRRPDIMCLCRSYRCHVGVLQRLASVSNQILCLA